MVAWSSGKDSAWALRDVIQTGIVRPVGLLTTVTREFHRVSMHGVRERILELQADALGLPVTKVEIPSPCPNATYESLMGQALGELEKSGVETIVFGDLFLEDIRAYRERQLKTTGLRPLFPLWKRDTALLAKEMISGGLEAWLVCGDPKVLPASFVGRRFDDTLLEELPAGIDPCGENGEFHTCVLDGPMFRHRISATTGPIVERDGFVFADLIPT